jgi:divalent metal cation (Fe/Co/Zn/Cd) transporter
VSARQKAERRSLTTARILLIVTILYNAAEGILAIAAGAAASSLALVAFGADSYLEIAAGLAVLWRINISDPERGEAAERLALRVIGWTFLALSVAIIFQAASAFASRDGAEESIFGIALALASVVVMPALALWKLKVAADVRLLALAAEAKETIACSYLSLTLLAGLVANLAFGWWWLDPVTALLLVPRLVREGLEGIRGDTCFEGLTTCFCRACLYGLRQSQAVCCPRPAAG